MHSDKLHPAHVNKHRFVIKKSLPLIYNIHHVFCNCSFSGGSVHVLDLKLDSRSKAETLRSSSDLGVAVATYLSWDDGSGKLYIGDDLGRVHLMMVYANKVGQNRIGYGTKIV
ncbi:hypothetical protein DPMN_001090 [Dreissena polymorpha]|uniref:Uncharacterized protein n=1 Tax=Dreissena polymorpha TaxID=45954 RepID=A0A9D4RSI0_DREPO|nr:hypothetical protein DPMN_001090 [Dreissena polymorpha]